MGFNSIFGITYKLFLQHATGLRIIKAKMISRADHHVGNIIQTGLDGRKTMVKGAGEK